MPVGAFAFGLAHESQISDGVVHDLALVGAHRSQGNCLAGFLHRSDGVFSDLLQVAGTLGTVAVDIQHQPGAVLRRGEDGEPGQLLKGLKDFAVTAHQAVQPGRFLFGDDRDVRAAVADLDVDVAIDVRDVQQFLEVVRSDVAFFFEAAGGNTLAGAGVRTL